MSEWRGKFFFRILDEARGRPARTRAQKNARRRLLHARASSCRRRRRRRRLRRRPSSTQRARTFVFFCCSLNARPEKLSSPSSSRRYHCYWPFDSDDEELGPRLRYRRHCEAPPLPPPPPSLQLPPPLSLSPSPALTLRRARPASERSHREARRFAELEFLSAYRYAHNKFRPPRCSQTHFLLRVLAAARHSSARTFRQRRCNRRRRRRRR